MWNFDGNTEALKTSDAIWDDDTGETVAQAFARFSEGLDLIPNDIANELVPNLMRAGIEVWSFGYGDEPEWFTTLPDEAPDDDEMDDWADGTNMQVWGPFALDWQTISRDSMVRFGADWLADASASPFMPDILDALLMDAAKAIRERVGIEPTTTILGTSPVKS